MSANEAEAPDVKPVLVLTDVSSGYGRTTVLRYVNLSVMQGQTVAVLGSNGAGKTTLLRTITGLARLHSGRIEALGVDISSAAPFKRTQAGICLIPEGRGIFRTLSVKDNLMLARPPWMQSDAGGLDRAVELFPVLGERPSALAGTLSGGQQQMLALARAFICEPSVVLVDEVSLGLAPIVVDAIFAALMQLASKGISLVIVEQYVSRALEVADQVFLVRHGEIVDLGSPDGIDEAVLREDYLGVVGAQQT